MAKKQATPLSDAEEIEMLKRKLQQAEETKRINDELEAEKQAATMAEAEAANKKLADSVKPIVSEIEALQKKTMENGAQIEALKKDAEEKDAQIVALEKGKKENDEKIAALTKMIDKDSKRIAALEKQKGSELNKAQKAFDKRMREQETLLNKSKKAKIAEVNKSAKKAKGKTVKKEL